MHTKAQESRVQKERRVMNIMLYDRDGCIVPSLRRRCNVEARLSSRDTGAVSRCMSFQVKNEGF